MLAGRQCDTIILYTRYMGEKATTPLINSIAILLLVVNHDVSRARDRTIFFERGDAAYWAISYLTSQGYSDIARIAVLGHTSTGKSRLMRYRKALEKNDTLWDPDKVKYGDSTMTRGYKACRELLEEETKFGALFAYDDDMVLGMSEVLHQAGLKIPTDVSLFGFDDAPSVKRLEPGLSAAYLPIDTVMITATDQAVRLANGGGVKSIPPFTGKLVLHDSVTTEPYYK